MQPHKLRPLEYDAIQIGEEFGPVDIVLDEHRVRSFAYAVDDFNPWFFYESPFGGPIAPPTLFSWDDPAFATLWGARYDLSTDRALASRYEVRSFAPMKLGERVLLQGRYVDKYVKRGKGYVVREFDVLDANDRQRLVWTRSWEMIAMTPGVVVGAGTAVGTADRARPRETDLPPVDRAHPEVPADSPLPTLTKHVTRKQIFVFSARPGWWTNIHTDRVFARSTGLPDVVAQGLMTTAYISQLCTRFFGVAWLRSGWSSMAFLKPVLAEDVLLVKAVVNGIVEDPEGPRLQLDVWAENQHRQVVTVGRAGAHVDP